MMQEPKDQTVAHQAADVVDNVADGIRSAAHSARDGVRNAAQTARDVAGRAAGAVGHKYDEVGQYARDSFNGARDRARSWENSFESSIRENPKTAILIAAAVGAALAACWKRR
jgi:ElaB/YqjD/DUF883 family membrane-anchored ribosome-binding protein